MAKKRKNNRRNLLLLVTLSVLIGFFAYGSFNANYSSANTENPTGVSYTYREAFIDKLAPKAQEIHRNYGLLPSVTMAQGILESDWGQSALATQENNYYGVKGASDAEHYQTREYNGEWTYQNEPFRSYSTFEESMEDYAQLLYYGTDWNSELYSGVVAAGHYSEATAALQQAGYATDPGYTQKLNRIIETYGLEAYDY